MRGAHIQDAPIAPKKGIIPACAGSTFCSGAVSHMAWDHPRMCGEHNLRPACKHCNSGSSPHVRGAPSVAMRSRVAAGIIPACAGSTCRRHGTGPEARDHPRMCGEHEGQWCMPDWDSGSSPHVRGAPNRRATRLDGRGIIPACAGSTPWTMPSPRRRWDHPRMCGEHQPGDIIVDYDRGSSPHVRGALVRRNVRFLPYGIIPACAGSTDRRRSKCFEYRDHPRMCGEHTSKIA